MPVPFQLGELPCWLGKIVERLASVLRLRRHAKMEREDAHPYTILKGGELRTKTDYFARSREQGLSNRCPILAQCARRSRTLQLVTRRCGVSVADTHLSNSHVPMVGEEAYLVGGNRNFLSRGLCPEVALFDPSNFFPGMGGFPATAVQYDEYFPVPNEILDTGHFSECAEYATCPPISFTGATAEECNQEVPPASAVAPAVPSSISIHGLSGVVDGQAGRDINVHNYPPQSYTEKREGAWAKLSGVMAAIGVAVALIVLLFGDRLLG